MTLRLWPLGMDHVKRLQPEGKEVKVATLILCVCLILSKNKIEKHNFFFFR